MKQITRFQFQLPTFLAVVWMTLLTCSCSDEQKSPQGRGKVIIKGSNTIGEELGPRLIQAYTKDHPGVVFELESKGTGSGVEALMAGKCDIAAASRVISASELDQARTNQVNLNVHTIGSYSVGVIVNTNCAVTNLSRDQLRDVFIGAVKNWKELGGPDAPINKYIRDPKSGTYLGFRELAMEDKKYAEDCKTATNYEGIAEMVAKDPAGIGYCSFSAMKQPGVKPVAIRGVTPDNLAVNEGRYPFCRVLRLYTNKDKETPATLDFIQFVQGPKGQQVLEQLGFVAR
jgi:phosphate transport system substrate-binding protein